MYIVTFLVPDTFLATRFPTKYFLYLEKIELHEVKNGIGTHRSLYTYWMHETAYGHEGPAFRARLSELTQQPAQPEFNSTVLDVNAVRKSWLRRFGVWVVAAVLGSFAALEWASKQLENIDKLTSRLEELKSEINVHLVPPKDIRRSKQSEFDVPVEIHNFSKYNAPELVFESARIRKGNDETKIERPDVYQFPEIKGGENKTVMLTCPRLAAGEYEMQLSMCAKIKLKQDFITIRFPVLCRRLPHRALNRRKRNSIANAYASFYRVQHIKTSRSLPGEPVISFVSARLGPKFAG
jgi:hypothetical protein